MSKVDILRALIAEKMTVAVREILAVVEATVAGYEDEVLSLKRELGDKRQLDAILQPTVRLHRIVEDDAGGAPGVSSCVSADQSKDVLRFTFKGINDFEASEKCTGQNGADGVATKVSPEETVLEHEDSDCPSADLPSDDSVSCPENTEEALRDDPTTDAQITRSKRKRRLPKRYRSDHVVKDKDHEKNRDNERKSNKNNKLQPSNVKKRRVIKLRICLLKNCPDADQSNKALSDQDSVQTILCQQNLSESDFLKHLRSTFPELRENKPFEAFLADQNVIKRSVPDGAKRMTQTELYTAFRSHKERKFNFYIQLKEDEETCDTVTDAQTASHDEPTTSGLEAEAPSETGGTSELANEQNMSSMDCVAQSEDGKDDDVWSPEQFDT